MILVAILKYYKVIPEHVSTPLGHSYHAIQESPRVVDADTQSEYSDGRLSDVYGDRYSPNRSSIEGQHELPSPFSNLQPTPFFRILAGRGSNASLGNLSLLPPLENISERSSSPYLVHPQEPARLEFTGSLGYQTPDVHSNVTYQTSDDQLIRDDDEDRYPALIPSAHTSYTFRLIGGMGSTLISFIVGLAQEKISFHFIFLATLAILLSTGAGCEIDHVMPYLPYLRQHNPDQSRNESA